MQHVRAPKARLYATCETIVCDTPQPARQGRYILLVYYIKTKSRLSDRPADISAVSALIDVGLARHESCVFWNHVVCLYESSSTMVRPHECAKGTSVSYTAINS